jgi:3-dehydroquinate synthase
MIRLDQHFQVSYHYPVFFSKNIFQKENPVLRDFFVEFGGNDYQKKVFFVIEKSILDYNIDLKTKIKNYFQGQDRIHLVDEILVLEGGEKCKNSEIYYRKVMDSINEHGIDRHSFVACIGGGAFLDMVGFGVAIAHRGINLLRFPTTVLSQNDSGVGVKNSINFYHKKNFLGTFAIPFAVFNDFNFLKSLDKRDQRAGIAEAIKVSLIKDLEFFEWLEENAEKLMLEDSLMEEQIIRCAKIHMSHIASGDPFEKGSARPLDFGHWLAHRIEFLTNYSLRHGEAVAIGIAVDTYYSFLIGRITEKEALRVIDTIHKIGFKIHHSVLEEENINLIFEGLNEFREHLGGKLTITILNKLGEGIEIHEIKDDTMKKAILKMKEL